MADPAPLSPFRVIDRSATIAGRFAARLFAVLGAEVVRDAASDDSLIGRGGEAGRAFGRWLDQGKVAAPSRDADADAVLVIGEGVAATRGELVLDIAWFDAAGPYADWRGNDPVVQALVALTLGFGPAEGPPLIAQGHAPQLAAGVTAFIAALGALIGRARGASIGRVETAIFEAACCFTEPNAVSYAHFGERGQRLGLNRFIPTYPCSIYRTADGWVGVTALTPAQWTALAAMIGRPDLADDPRFATTLDRLAQADAVDAVLAPFFATRNAADVAEEGQARRIPMTPVSDPAELPALDHWRARGAFRDGPDGPAPHLPWLAEWDGATRPLEPLRPGDLPLAGVRVVDFTMGWAGPLCTRTLADLGADVVKIESEVRPDWWRGWEKPAPGQTVEAAPVFSVVNRGKRGVLLDLTTPDGLAAAEALVARADVVVDNFAPGVLAKLGLGAERLRDLRPGLVAIAMGAFGATGRWRGFRAYGSTVEQASGIPIGNGHDGDPPAIQHIAFGDPVAGLFAAAAALTGLAARDRFGGCAIDLAQVETLFQLNADAIIARHVTAEPLPRTGSRRATMAPCCCVKAAGANAWLTVACDDADWPALARMIGRLGWCGWGLAQRQAHAGEIEAALAAWAADRSAAEAAQALQAAGVPAAAARSVETLVEDAQLAASGFWVTLERAHLGRYRSGAAPYRFDGRRPCAATPAPTLGEHHEEVIGTMLENWGS